MNNPNLLDCDVCGERAYVTQLAVGIQVCSKCLPGLPRSRCVDCGRRMVGTHDGRTLRCLKCRVKEPYVGLPCARCGDRVARNCVVFEEQLYCAGCSGYAREERPCSCCGRLFRKLQRSTLAGLDELACAGCIARHSPRCRICYRSRPVVGEVDGRDACSECLKRGAKKRLKCQSCGREEIWANTNICRGCTLNRRCRTNIQSIRASLRSDFVQELYDQFVLDSGLESNPKSCLQTVNRNINGFHLLEASIPSRECLTAPGVIEALWEGRDRKKFRGLRSWLGIRHGLDFSSEESEACRHRLRMRDVLASLEASWMEAVLEGYLAWLHRGRQKLKEHGLNRSNRPRALSSIEVSVKRAADFLSYLQSVGVSSELGINQANVDAYAAQKPKVVSALAAYIHYLNFHRNRLVKLKLEYAQHGKNTTVHVLPAKVRDHLAREWLQAEEERELRNSVVALLILFYARKSEVTLALHLDDVHVTDERVEIAFPQETVEIFEPIAGLVRRWLGLRRDLSRYREIGENNWLFPGLTADTALNKSTFRAWLKEEYQVLETQLFATAIHELIEGGLQHPGYLAIGLGLSESTAQKYWLDSGHAMMSFAGEEYVDMLREAGEFVRPESSNG